MTTAKEEMNLLPTLRTRREYIHYFDHRTLGVVDELSAHATSHPLVKGYLLETSLHDGAREAMDAFRSLGQRLRQIDDTLYGLKSREEDQEWSIVELVDSRYPVVYTQLASQSADRRINMLVEESSRFDRAWFTATMFNSLWQLVMESSPHSRFSQMVFEHSGLYEDPGLDQDDNSEDSSAGEEQSEDGHRFSPERRNARVQITERIGELNSIIRRMREYYHPLESLVRIRVPSQQRGGHDVLYNGKFVNRSDSFISLRQVIGDTVRIYGHATRQLEELAWPREGSTRDESHGVQGINLGSPFLIKFSEPLEDATFDRWMSALARKNNRFRLWGRLLSMGSGKAHLYGIDRHLWQPIDLEFTKNHVYGLLPAGTCGNTVHRLVTQIQRFVDPKLETFIGQHKYEDILSTIQ